MAIKQPNLDWSKNYYTEWKRESYIKRPLKSYSQLQARLWLVNFLCDDCFLSESGKLHIQSHMHKGWKNQRHFSL